MPIYEYYCSQCRSVFELTRPISESEKPAKCPKGHFEAQKLVSVFATNADYRIRYPEKEAFRKLEREDPLNKSRE